MVDKRYDAEHFERVNYMEDYGKKICKAAGLSLNVEMVPVQTKLGGNGPESWQIRWLVMDVR